jgi:hypothetical protein
MFSTRLRGCKPCVGSDIRVAYANAHEPEVGGRSRQGTAVVNLLVEDTGAVEGAFEVRSILKFAHLLHINRGAIWEHLD